MRTLVMVFLTIMIVMGTFSSASAELRRVSVVIDPSSERIDQYSYRHDLSEIAKQELETRSEFVSSRGYRFLISSQDVAPIQQELELNNSKWGNQNSSKQIIGGFAAAEEVWYISAYISSASESGIGGASRDMGIIIGNSSAGIRVIIKRSLVGRDGRTTLQTMNSDAITNTGTDIVIGAKVKIADIDVPFGYVKSSAKDIRGAINNSVSVALQALENAPAAQNNATKSSGPQAPQDSILSFWQQVESLGENNFETPNVYFSKPIATKGSKWVVVQGEIPLAVVEIQDSVPTPAYGGKFAYSVIVRKGAAPAGKEYRLIKYKVK